MVGWAVLEVCVLFLEFNDIEMTTRTRTMSFAACVYALHVIVFSRQSVSLRLKKNVKQFYLSAKQFCIVLWSLITSFVNVASFNTKPEC